MNRILLFIAAAGLLAPAAGYPQQGAPVRVTATVHPDGTRTDRQVNPDEHTSIETTYDAAGKVMRKIVYKLDEKGNPSESTAFDAKGMPALKMKFTVDAENHVSERVDYTPAGKFIRKIVYQYDATGKVNGVQVLDETGKPIPKR
jgi:antitoxin component YwqK of YwqJK toxin-antitoxin module